MELGQFLIHLLGVSHGGEVGGEGGVVKRLLNDVIVSTVTLLAALALRVDTGAHRGVEGINLVRSLHRNLGCDAGRTPVGLHHLHVLRVQVAALVEHGQGHRLEGHLDIADLLYFLNPARGQPRERARAVEPERDLLSHSKSPLLCSLWHPTLGV